jgi:beta-aspartyl-peptidase (threonine type)
MIAKIIVHGGAGFWKRDIRQAVVGVGNSAEAGRMTLARGGSALDAVEAAVSVMEDDPIFNAGKGSALTWIGTVEMDAAIMDGRNLSAGAVALVHETKNPVQLARIVMEKTDHVLLAGSTAEKLAKAFNLPSTNPITARRQRMLREAKKNPRTAGISGGKRIDELLREHPELIGHDTVGAVAVDAEENFAAAASTGGTLMKLPGRIGDTPLIGSGLYSDNKCGAATVTGFGEVSIKLALSRTVCMMMERGNSALKAATSSVKMASERLNGPAGVIAIDLKGGAAAVHNTAYMPWAFWSASMKRSEAHARGRMVARLK